MITSIYIRRPILVIVLLLLAAGFVTAEKVVEVIRSEEESFRLIRLAGGLERPWGMAFLPDGDMLITERGGALYRFSSGDLIEIEGVPRVSTLGQGGLLDVALHPDFEENGRVYFTYSARYALGAGTALARARLEGNRLVSVEELFRINKASGRGQHFGSRIVFGRDGYIYMSVGDRGERDRAQDKGDHAGSVLRLTAEGGIPVDNPFREERGTVPELFTMGHRNIQGMTVHPETGRVWTHEHGPKGGDEVNILSPGLNYGWPLISYGDEYVSGRPVGPTEASGLEQPLLYWKPSIAPSGMTFYSGSVFPGWKGDLFVGALKGQHLRRVRIEGTRVVEQEMLLTGVVGRIRDVRMGPDEKIYILTDAQNGALYRLDP